jgi:nucleoside-diphosphate-sugar epimerase
MARVLVTGGGGFIGRHLVESQLKQGHQVRTVDLRTSSLAELAGQPDLEIVTGDLSDPACARQLVEGIDTVYHLASAHLDTSLPESHYRRVNVDAAVGLLEAAVTSNARRYVHCSSVGVIGDTRGIPADETTECEPTNVYERTKHEGEQAVIQRAARLDFPVVVARPAWVYGPRCPRTAKLIRSVRKGRFPIFGDGQTLRHPIYVSDAVDALERCADVGNAAGGEIYIIAGPQWLTVEELLQAVASVVGVQAPSRHLPVWVGKAGGYGLEVAFGTLGKSPPFSRRSVDFFLKDNAYDTGKAERELGFNARVDLRSGLKMSLDWLNGAGAAGSGNGHTSGKGR